MITHTHSSGLGCVHQTVLAQLVHLQHSFRNCKQHCKVVVMGGGGSFLMKHHTQSNIIWRPLASTLHCCSMLAFLTNGEGNGIWTHLFMFMSTTGFSPWYRGSLKQMKPHQELVEDQLQEAGLGTQWGGSEERGMQGKIAVL